MATVSIDGRSVSIINGRVVIDGVPQDGSPSGVVEIRMDFKRLSAEELRNHGWAPEAISEHEGEGPFAVACISNAMCEQCGHSTMVAWTVVNLITADELGIMWTHGDAECEAHEMARKLNDAWRDGYRAGALAS